VGGTAVQYAGNSLSQELQELYGATGGFAQSFGSLAALGIAHALQGRRPHKAEAVGPDDDKPVQRTDLQQVARIIAGFKRAALALSVADLAAVEGMPELGSFKELLAAIYAVLSQYQERFPVLAQSAHCMAQAIQQLPATVEGAASFGSHTSCAGDGSSSDGAHALPAAAAGQHQEQQPQQQGLRASAVHKPAISLGLGCRAMPLGPLTVSRTSSTAVTSRVCDMLRPFAAAAAPGVRKLYLNMVGMSHVQAAVVGPAGQQHKLTVGLDNGCSIDCCSEQYFVDNFHRFIYPGSSAQLCELDQPLAIGMFAGRETCEATHCLLGLPLLIGQGVYTVDLLIVKGGNFNLVLGNSFLYNYAGRIWQQDYSNREEGRYIILPLPQRLCQPGVTAPQPPANAHPHWYPQQRIPLQYDVCTDTLTVKPVSEYALA
jgi:hypothetical protein